MKFFTNKTFILLFILLIIILRYEYFYRVLELAFVYTQLLLTDYKFASEQFNFNFFDVIFSLIFFVSVSVFVLIRGSRIKWVNEKVSLTSAFLIILISFFSAAPAFSRMHPDFQQNLGVTRLLTPFSSVYMIHLKKEPPPDDMKGKFLLMRSLVVPQSYDHNMVFADRFRSTSAGFIYYQKDKEFRVPFIPVIDKKMFFMGTDQYGRDVLSRLIYGARISLLVGMGAVTVAFLFGFVLGFAAGYPGGITDTILNRFADIFLSFPVIFLVILIISLFGNSILTVIIVLGFSGWMSLFKIVRGEVMDIKNKDYIISARMAGLNFYELMFKEVLPVITVPVIVNLVFQFANVILAEAALSYLGMGTGENYPSWGAMIQSSQGYLPEAWWMLFFPGAAIILTIFVMNKTGKRVNINLLRNSYDQQTV